MSDAKVRNIMLVTTELVDTDGAEHTAMEMAIRNGALVMLVDSIRTPFHLPDLGSISADNIFESAMRVKKEYLDKAAERFRTAGIETETHILETTRTSEEIARFALEHECDVVIRYFKGEHSRSPGRYGHTAKNLMRVCPCPLLLVDQAIAKNPAILACLKPTHGFEENEAILNAAESLASTAKQLNALCCWDFRIPLKLQELTDAVPVGVPVDIVQPNEKDFKHIADSIVEEIESRHDMSGYESRLIVEHADPIKQIPQHCIDHSIDVVVMSSASLNHPLGRLLGSTIENTIEQLPCALLVVKPVGFVSPVSLKRAEQTVA